MIHELKTVPPYFEHVLEGDKTFEIRFNDRDFSVGDTLRLREYENGEYLGRELWRRVTYVLGKFGVLPGFVVLGLGALEPTTKKETTDE